MTPISRIRKRDGRIVKFDQNKISDAIWRSAKSAGGTDQKLSEKIASQVCNVLEVFFKGDENIPNVEQIQDLVEKILIENGHAKTAKAYILYRERHNKIREQKANVLGMETDSKFSLSALKILRQHYLLKDEKGNIAETPEQMLKRVAHNIAEADKFYPEPEPTISLEQTLQNTENKFYDLMNNLDFLPDNPILMNAGTMIEQLASHVVLPLEDDLGKIFETLKQASLISQSGTKIGLNFSSLRPKNDIVESSHGTASGPVTFIKIFETVLNNLHHGQKKQGRHLVSLNVNHPDILEFIAYLEKGSLSFNTAIIVTRDFMEAVISEQEYEVINPRTMGNTNRLSAKAVFNLILASNWKNNQPRIIFSEQMQKSIQSINGSEKLEYSGSDSEQPLFPYEASFGGAINVANFSKKGEVDWERLKQTIQSAVHFLDNSIDMCRFVTETIETQTKNNRKIGLGISGFGSLLFKLGVSYASDKSLEIAEKIMSFIQKETQHASENLANSRGSFSNFDQSIYPQFNFKAMRNATQTTIARSNILSKMSGTTRGIEALSEVVTNHKTIDNSESLVINSDFAEQTKKLDLYSKDLMRKIANGSSIKDVQEIPKELKKIFVVSKDVSAKDHLEMQKTFQKFTDNAVAKTIYLGSNTGIEEIKKILLTAYSSGCKSIHLMRGHSAENTAFSSGRAETENRNQQISLPFQEEENINKKKSQNYGLINNKIQEIVPPPIQTNEFSENRHFV